ncbi:MAG: hypothetical protein LHW56_09250 [Candidatus Cloacimonetes bacterium]|nr:hypothetical protein [Candidatus Cloacimonadota bacterium]MDY0173077.1 hypothetical protein [Candidatus Cloacimonadaceae bacterium]
MPYDEAGNIRLFPDLLPMKKTYDGTSQRSGIWVLAAALKTVSSAHILNSSYIERLKSELVTDSKQKKEYYPRLYQEFYS